MGIRQTSSLLNAGMSANLGSVHDVVLDRHGKQDWLLLHQTDLVTEPLGIILQDVHSVDKDGASLAIVETLDEIDEGGLAASRGANKGKSLTRGKIDREAVHDLDLGPGWVMEVHILELNVSFNPVGSNVTSIVVDSWNTIQQLEDTTRSSDRLHELRKDGDQGGEGKHRLESEKHVRHETTNRHLILEDQLTTIPHRDQDTRISSQVRDGRQSTSNPRPALDDEVGNVDLVSVMRNFLLFHNVGTNCTNVGQGFIGLGASIGQRNQLLLSQNLHTETLKEHANSNHRDERQNNQGQLPVVRENGNQPNDNLAQGNEPSGKICSHHHLNDLGIGRKTVEKLTNSDSIKESDILTKHVSKNQGPEAARATGCRNGIQNRGEQREHTISHVDTEQVKSECSNCRLSCIQGGIMNGVDDHTNENVLRHMQKKQKWMPKRWQK
mmetsp:Transcript_45993/g.144258  ORF Transcript_45993/g.144258 Transcript_45993/m.144258 type:complete len:439 (+) Transcript_45993:721-2037(+)